jgi:hypothetical protein
MQKREMLLSVYNLYEKEEWDAHGQETECYREQPFDVQKNVQETAE